MAHKAKIIHVHAVADGILAVKVRCCDDHSTDSVLSLHQLHRPEEEIDADIQNHLEIVQEKHAARDHAQAHIERLMKK